MKFTIPCEITFDVDEGTDKVRGVEIGAALRRSGRGTQFRRVNEKRAQEKQARLQAARAACLDMLRTSRSCKQLDFRTALTSVFGRNAIIEAIHSLHDEGLIVLDRYGMYSAAEVKS